MNTALYDYILSLPLFDSNESLPPVEELRPRRDIIAEFMGDMPAESLAAAGLPPEKLELARGGELSIREKWELIAPYWSRARFTPGCRAAELASRELYGFDAINRESIEALDATFRSTFGGDRYNYIMRERCNIELAVLFAQPSGTADRRYFLPSADIGGLVAPDSREALLAAGREVGVTASAFDDYLEACARKIGFLSADSRALTCETAGRRMPSPYKTSYSDARSAFDSFMEDSRYTESSALQRFLYRFLLGLASERGMTFRLDEDSRSCAFHDDPDGFRGLSELFPKLKFDILVSAYPRRHSLGYMAGLLPNVYVNLSRSVGAAAEYLEFVPYNKIIVFGGGCTTVDAIYGRAALARENLARVLSEKIGAGVVKPGDARTVARALTCGNAREIYRPE